MAAQKSRNAAGSSNGGSAAARSETKPKTYKFEGLTLKLPAKLPFRVLRHMRGEVALDGIIGFLEDVLGPEQMDQVWNLDIDVEQGTALIEKILDLYGLSVGESPASTRS